MDRLVGLVVGVDEERVSFLEQTTVGLDSLDDGGE